jgi:hypothetical protein
VETRTRTFRRRHVEFLVMRLELVLVGLLILSPLTGCLSGGEDLDQTNTSRADPPTGENLSSEEAGENATANTSGPDEPANDTTEPETAPEHSPENPPTAVVALIDRGINPYHEAFRDDSPLAHVHPSTYIEGFPEDAEALNLTLEADSYAAALEADREVWANVSDGELYWIPGTRIVARSRSRTAARARVARRRRSWTTTATAP